jgi:hypothetical protein
MESKTERRLGPSLPCAHTAGRDDSSIIDLFTKSPDSHAVALRRIEYLEPAYDLLLNARLIPIHVTAV